jgi:hypothetical protein
MAHVLKMLHDIYIKSYSIFNHFTKERRKTMAISIDDYLNSVSAITTAAQSAAVSGSAKTTADTSSDTDSYIASNVDPDAVLPSDNYNDILKVMQNAKAETASSDSNTSTGSGTASASASTDTESVGGAGGAGGGGGSDEDDDETTTEVVTINGVTYLETTTVSDGITTVTRTPIGDSEK